MKKHEFLALLEKQADSPRLVEYYEELIIDRVNAGEDEATVVASFDIKRIIRQAELERQGQIEPQTQVLKVEGGKNWIVPLIVMLLSLAVLIASTTILAVGVSELVEELRRVVRDDEWYEYIIMVAVGGFFFLASLIVGSIFTHKFVKARKVK